MSYHILWLSNITLFLFFFLQIEEMGLGKRSRCNRGTRKSSSPRSSRIVKPIPAASITIPPPLNAPPINVKKEPMEDLMALVKPEEDQPQPLPVISSTFSVPKPPTTLIPLPNVTKVVKMVRQPVQKTHSPILQNSVVVPLTTASLTSPSTSSSTQLVAPTTTTFTTLPTLSTRPSGVRLSSVPTKVVITSDTFRSRPEYPPQTSHIPVASTSRIPVASTSHIPVASTSHIPVAVQPQQPTILIQRPAGLQQSQHQQRVVLLQPSLPHQRRPDNIKVFQVQR